MPGNAYAVAFVRTYASRLGLDPDEMGRRFKAEAGKVTRKTKLAFPVPVPERGVPAGAVVLLGVTLAVGAYAGWYRLSGEGRLPAEGGGPGAAGPAGGAGIPPAPAAFGRPRTRRPAPADARTAAGSGRCPCGPGAIADRRCAAPAPSVAATDAVGRGRQFRRAAGSRRTGPAEAPPPISRGSWCAPAPMPGSWCATGAGRCC